MPIMVTDSNTHPLRYTEAQPTHENHDHQTQTQQTTHEATDHERGKTVTEGAA
jgi:hypothetical protein